VKGHHIAAARRSASTWRSRRTSSDGCTIERHRSFTVNTTIVDDTIIGRETLIRVAGVCILADVEPYSVFKRLGAKHEDDGPPPLGSTAEHFS
jgi:acetyltransferase-like isoleucine patch superfamily enzyme